MGYEARITLNEMSEVTADSLLSRALLLLAY